MWSKETLQTKNDKIACFTSWQTWYLKKKDCWELSNFMDMHSSDVDLDPDLGTIIRICFSPKKREKKILKHILKKKIMHSSNIFF